MESSSAAARPTNLSFSLTEESAAFPDVAIRWILKYSCTTNSNLAVISNINKHCRAVTCDVIEEMLKAAQNQNLSSSPTQITTKQLIQQKEEEEIKGNQKVVVTPSFSEYKHLSALLLPEMTLEILRQAKNNNNSRSSANTVTPNSMIPPSSLFCLAWFHPTGIQIQSIDTNAQSDDEDHNCLSSSSSSSSSSKHNGNEEFGGEYRHELWECRQKLQQNISRRAQVLNNSGVIRGLNTNYELAQNCSNEWRGYRNAMDVLLPLGYKTYFVQTVLNMASKLSLANNALQAISSDERETTFAVRGATFARPQGYCLCWDADQAVSKLASQLSNLDMDNISHKNNDGDESKNQRNHIHHHNNQTQRNNYKLHDLRRRKRKHDKMRRIKMKASLPRIIFSTEVKNPIYQVSNQDSNQNHRRRRRRHGVTTGDDTGGVPSSAILPGKRQKCLQFLNVDGSRAVYLRTPPFECGPVQTPVTMFCVGIATEDGCFVSGLESRFELGHIHGVDPMDKEIDMSPICICAENISGDKSEGRNEVNCIRSYSEDISDSSNDDYQIKRKGSIVCQCKIQYRKSDDENDSKEESLCLEPYPGNIYRGQIGPGRWHCYTATFNGDNPIIRVDGCTEQVKNHSKQSRRPYGDIPVLNGLTIGSDHCFEMPLCCGEGSDGEGEGSIAELIVFRGAMQVEDIECYEKYLMEKHGIVHGQQQIFPLEESALVENVGNHWQEDLWRRQAHALMSHPPPYELGGGASVPLRVAAKHRMVAWHRSNDVTGKNVRVSRIGSKISTGSSDW